MDVKTGNVRLATTLEAYIAERAPQVQEDAVEHNEYDLFGTDDDEDMPALSTDADQVGVKIRAPPPHLRVFGSALPPGFGAQRALEVQHPSQLGVQQSQGYMGSRGRTDGWDGRADPDV